jgi:hypothetical protein
MLPFLLTCSWLVVVTAVIAVCRAGAAADRASATQLSRAKRPPRLNGVPGLTVWDHSDRVRLERSKFASRRVQARRPRGAHSCGARTGRSGAQGPAPS